MPRIENGEEFLTGKEVKELLNASNNRFYRGLQSRLLAYHFDGKLRPHYYKKSEVLELKSGRPTRREPITISGIFTNWTTYIRSQGYQADTITHAIEIETLPEEVRATFHIPPERKFVRRTRLTKANGMPICVWDSYYPLELIEGDILPEMQQDPSLDVIHRIKEVHQIKVKWEKDRYTARNPTLEEQERLQLLTNEPVLILQRGCWSSDKQILTHISHMTLLGSWFAVEHEKEVKAWDQ